MPIKFTKYYIYEFFDDKKGEGYNGGDHLKEARATPWKNESSKQRYISVDEKGKDYVQMRDGTVYQCFHVDYWEFKGKNCRLYGRNPILYSTLEDAKQACKELLEKNPRGRKRNYITYTVREDGDNLKKYLENRALGF